MKKNEKKNRYEIYYFNKKNEIYVGCTFEGTIDEVFDVAKDHCFKPSTYFVVLHNGTFVYVANENLNERNFWKEVIYYNTVDVLIEIIKCGKI